MNRPAALFVIIVQCRSSADGSAQNGKPIASTIQAYLFVVAPKGWGFHLFVLSLDL